MGTFYNEFYGICARNVLEKRNPLGAQVPRMTASRTQYARYNKLVYNFLHDIDTLRIHESSLHSSFHLSPLSPTHFNTLSNLRPFSLFSLHHRIILTKIQTHTVNTMPFIRRGVISLPFKHMSQMSPTIATHDFRPCHPKTAIRMSRYSTGYAIEICRPSAAG
jgi:hypothetical protein